MMARLADADLYSPCRWQLTRSLGHQRILWGWHVTVGVVNGVDNSQGPVVFETGY